MNIIKKIEIRHFRSFDSGKGQKKVEIDDLKDLNVFSGANDSGKSNVLRALNLFFNNEISPGIKFDKNRDFSKIVANRFDEDIESRKALQAKGVTKSSDSVSDEKLRDLRRSDEIISIKLFFNNNKKQRGLPEKFWISKSYSKKNNFQGEYIYQTDLKGNAQVTLFINSFTYEYVPAIKDKAYFSHLFEKLQHYLFEKGDKKKENQFASSSKHLNGMLQSETQDLFNQFQQSSGVDANFHIPSTLVDFFRTLSVRTENDISLFDRGDGVQARFIPEILDEISKHSKKNIIWGYEEPENSYEAKNIRKIRDEFLEKYSREKQIFVTSHTKELLSIKRRLTKREKSILDDKTLNTKTKKEAALTKLGTAYSSSDVSIYRVWKNTDTKNTSLVTRFDEKNEVWEDTCDDLGIIQEARIIDDLQEKLELQAKEIESSNLSIENQQRIQDELNTELKRALDENESVKSKIEEYEKPILIVEDKLNAIYKIAYLKVRNIMCTTEDYEKLFAEKSPFTIRCAEGAKILSQRLREPNTNGYDDKKVIGLFDFDKEGSENFNRVQTNSKWDRRILGDQNTGFYIKRTNHPCFYGMLLPIPERHNGLVDDIRSGNFESLIEIENLLSDEVLNANKLVDTKTIRITKYLKIKKKSKAKLPKILTALGKDEFKDFVPLYDKIEELFY